MGESEEAGEESCQLNNRRRSASSIISTNNDSESLSCLFAPVTKTRGIARCARTNAFELSRFLGLEMRGQTERFLGHIHAIVQCRNPETFRLSPCSLAQGLSLVPRVLPVVYAYSTGLDVLTHAGCGTAARQEAGQVTPVPIQTNGNIP